MTNMTIGGAVAQFALALRGALEEVGLLEPTPVRRRRPARLLFGAAILVAFMLGLAAGAALPFPA